EVMDGDQTCPECGKPVGRYVSCGLCPQCMLEGVMAEDEAFGDGAPTEELDSQAGGTTGPEEVLGQTIGPYRILSPLGRGGFGEVYMAEQRRPVRRKVALKVLKRGMDTRQVVARFEAERQVLALMNHPNIAKVYDAGETADGRPFFVMELVDGELVTHSVRKRGLPALEILRIFREVCFAVEHAHQRGVIHRDLKPSNVLVTTVDGTLRPKVIDFGIAKATEGFLTEGTLHTGPFQLLGTLEYMSPEQVDLGGLQVDTRSDVYALGVLLYELLTGTTPLKREELLRMTQDESIRCIREEVPESPRMRLRSLDRRKSFPLTGAGTFHGGIGSVRRRMSSDLDWIVMKALEKEPHRRYQSVAELGEDVDRYLSGRPVEARAPSRIYRLQKWVRRNRGVFAGVSAVILLGLLAGAGLLVNTAGSYRDRLILAEAAQLPVVVEQGKKFLWLPLLRDQLAKTAGDPGATPQARMRAAWALLEEEPRWASLLADYILSADLDEVRVLRPLVSIHRQAFLESALKALSEMPGEAQWLGESLEESRLRSARILRAAAVLALADSGNRAWEESAKPVAEALCAVNTSELGEWSRWLAPARAFLDSSLRSLFLQRDRPLSSNAAAVALATFQGDDLASKFDLVRAASPSQLTPALIESLAGHGDAAIEFLRRDLESRRFASFEDEGERESVAREQANSGLALILCGRGDLVWDALGRADAGGDDGVQTHLIHGLAAGGVDPREVLRAVQRANPRALRALLIALGEFNETELPVERRARLQPQLEQWAVHPDPGVHSTALWLAREWKLTLSLPERSSGADNPNPGWIRNGLGQDLLTVRAPAILRTGTGRGDAPGEMAGMRIEHDFAIGMLEVTEGEFDRFLEEFSGRLAWALDPGERRLNREGSESSASRIVDSEAQAFCIWLSEREGLDPAQQCYEVSEDLGSVRVRGDLTRLTGYRLPLEIEWEYACRAGAVTPRAFGSCRDRLPAYEVYGLNSGGVCWAPGRLRPNQFGMFDMLGNVAEWCHAGEQGGMWIRGASFLAALESVVEVSTRSQHTGNVGVPVVGFRIARTLER
ncbi:MAG TPA: bifunctional serine/threonine-protein kinase/formylglycine-generating enzyme family protein, partial [Verrucomicrobiales bacterium]|nr:bifunctional serine/threonine-protein kinase/formylglycine-generating enzyme family protein [Verrucomicrobiales bacterium]